LPKRGPWIANGRTLAKLVDTLHRTPQLVDGRIDADKIILVGHSFGATAVATALGEGAPVLGAVLLDPTAIGRGLSQLLRRIDVPVMVIGADEDIWPARNRGQFYRFIPRTVGSRTTPMRRRRRRLLSSAHSPPPPLVLPPPAT
jgi:dienelactone hydrolase